MRSLYITPGTTIFYAMGSWCSLTPAGNTSAQCTHDGVANIELDFFFLFFLFPFPPSRSGYASDICEQFKFEFKLLHFYAH